MSYIKKPDLGLDHVGSHFSEQGVKNSSSTLSTNWDNTHACWPGWPGRSEPTAPRAVGRDSPSPSLGHPWVGCNFWEDLCSISNWMRLPKFLKSTYLQYIIHALFIYSSHVAPEMPHHMIHLDLDLCAICVTLQIMS